MHRPTQYAAVLLALTSFGTTQAKPIPFKPLTQACEEALALSALPVHLRDKANVHVLQLDNGQFKQTIQSEGGFNCLVERNHAHAIVPQCVTPSGTDSILPGLKFRTQLTWSGHSPAEVNAQFDQAASAGKLVPPTQPGINYMMSAHNRIYIEARDNFSQVPAHVMIFAPNIDNDDVGGSQPLAMQNTGYPFVGQSGIHGYLISMVDQASDSADVLKSCEGQL